jgi:hypothetical protein
VQAQATTLQPGPDLAHTVIARLIERPFQRLLAQPVPPAGLSATAAQVRRNTIERGQRPAQSASAASRASSALR